jgi:hypothetical protein
MASEINRRLFIGGATVGLVAAASVPAWANGGEFYEVHDDPNQKVALCFLGRVKDNKGGYIEDAEIIINVDDPALSYSIFTDHLGHYRTTDIGQEILDILGAENFDPTKIQIKVVKDGYKQVVPKAATAPKKFGRVPLDFVMTAASA